VRRAAAGGTARRPLSVESPGRAGTSEMIEKSKKFMSDVVVEMKKVTWPTRTELRGSTMVVIVTVIIIAIFIGIVDRILSLGLERVLS
jgi:preprotein translocase subunit SecE